MQVPTHSTTRITPASRGWGACLIADSAAPIASHCGLLHCGHCRYLHTPQYRPDSQRGKVLRPHCGHRSSALQTTKVPSHSTMRTWFAVGGKVLRSHCGLRHSAIADSDNSALRTLRVPTHFGLRTWCAVREDALASLRIPPLRTADFCAADSAIASHPAVRLGCHWRGGTLPVLLALSAETATLVTRHLGKPAEHDAEG